jgi:hypothetical protein
MLFFKGCSCEAPFSKNVQPAKNVLTRLFSSVFWRIIFQKIDRFVFSQLFYLYLCGA